MSIRPEVWRGASDEQLARVEEAISRLAAIVHIVGYWTPIGKLMENLAYTEEPDASSTGVVNAILNPDTGIRTYPPGAQTGARMVIEDGGRGPMRMYNAAGEIVYETP